MDNEAVYAKIKALFIKKGLYMKLIPVDGSYITSERDYIERLQGELPGIYRELKENGVLPSNITYDLFMDACEWGIQTAEARFHYGPDVEIRR